MQEMGDKRPISFGSGNIASTALSQTEVGPIRIRCYLTRLDFVCVSACPSVRRISLMQTFAKSDIWGQILSTQLQDAEGRREQDSVSECMA